MRIFAVELPDFVYADSEKLNGNRVSLFIEYDFCEDWGNNFKYSKLKGEGFRGPFCLFKEENKGCAPIFWLIETIELEEINKAYELDNNTRPSDFSVGSNCPGNEVEPFTFWKSFYPLLAEDIASTMLGD